MAGSCMDHLYNLNEAEAGSTGPERSFAAGLQGAGRRAQPSKAADNQQEPREATGEEADEELTKVWPGTSLSLVRTGSLRSTFYDSRTGRQYEFEHPESPHALEHVVRKVSSPCCLPSPGMRLSKDAACAAGTPTTVPDCTPNCPPEQGQINEMSNPGTPSAASDTPMFVNYGSLGSGSLYGSLDDGYGSASAELSGHILSRLAGSLK